MNESNLSLLLLLAPVALLGMSSVSTLEPGSDSPRVKSGLRMLSFLSLALAAFGSVLVYQYGPLDSPLLGVAGLGLALRLDALSMLMFSMIAILAWVIFRYSLQYMQGDTGQGTFLGRLALTVAAVQLLVLSGNVLTLWIAWVSTSLALHQLLVFYRDRKRAHVAARKKFMMARIGDLFLGAALAVLYLSVGSGQLSAIFQAAAQGNVYPFTWELAALFLVLAAIFKSAQFPTHGWLVEVMETPTPVSALLHAGLLNAGPFLIVRFAQVMEGATVGPALLIVVAAFTALFGSAAYLTQPSVKTALGYSSIAHMGFSLLTCGLGVYAAAMLHMVAHSFYKAHSFLSSGSIIDQLRSHKVPTPARIGSPLSLVGALLLSLGLYLGAAFILSVDVLGNPALIVVGALVVLGLTQMLVQILDARQPWRVLPVAAALVIVVSLSFFILEEATHQLLYTQLPHSTAPAALIQGLMYTVLAVFVAVLIIQLVAPARPMSPGWRRLGIHLRNGFYANALLDQWLGAYHLEKAADVLPPEGPAPASQQQQPADVPVTIEG